jgi:hypothetical protein
VAWRTKLSLGRFLHFAREQGAPQLAEALDRECKGVVSLMLLRRSIFLIMCFACCFYALFLFDTLGDAVGLRGAYWVLIVMPLLPAVMWAAWRLRQHRRGLVAQAAPPNGSSEQHRGVELGTLGGHAVVSAREAPAVGGPNLTDGNGDKVALVQSDVTYNDIHADRL